LTRHDERLVIGVDERQAAIAGEVDRHLVAVVAVAVELEHLGAEALGCGASCGMRITACRPCSAADSATAWAWFPDEAVATPRSGASAVTALYAPRNLKAPMRWKFSALRNTSPPQRSSSAPHVRTGVRCATPRRR